MRMPSISRRRSVPLSAAILAGAAAALVFGPVNPIGAIRSGGEACSSVTPNHRALDTRSGAKLGPKSTIDVKVADVPGVPAGAKTVKLQITTTGLEGSPGTFLVAYPKGTAQPPSSNINPVSDHDSSNGAVPVAVGADESITIYNEQGSTHVIIDILEWCDEHNHDDDYYTEDEIDDFLGGVTMHPFEVRMSFGSSQVIAENGDLELSLRCREDDLTPDQDFTATDRNNMQFRAFSTGQFMTTYVDITDLYENEGVTIARALGSSLDGTMTQTTFLTRDGVRTAAAMTGADGSQIAVDGDSVQVMFNVDNATVQPAGDNTVDCCARGIVMMLPARS